MQILGLEEIGPGPFQPRKTIKEEQLKASQEMRTESFLSKKIIENLVKKVITPQ